MRETLRLATRGSDLARRQAATVRAALQDRRRDVELLAVETTGDQLRDELIQDLGMTGAFVRSVDERVIDGAAEVAVHSMKDVPTEDIGPTVVAAIPERAPRNDVLVTPAGDTLEDLPDGAVVGTSSLRRRAQLLNVRPDLTVEPLRGNVDTRVRKLLAPSLQAEHQRRLEAAEEDDEDERYDRSPEEWFDALSEIERQALEIDVETEYDAIVLAEAGLDRLGLLEDVAYQRLPTDQFVPAPGQGALAVTALEEDIVDFVQRTIEDPVARVEVLTERTVMAEVGAGCVAPLGVTARLQGDTVSVRAQVLSLDGTEMIEVTRSLPAEDYHAAARSLAADLIDRGADDLIEQAVEEANE